MLSLQYVSLSWFSLVIKLMLQKAIFIQITLLSKTFAKEFIILAVGLFSMALKIMNGLSVKNILLFTNSGLTNKILKKFFRVALH